MDLREARMLPRVVHFAVAACRLAMQDSGLDTWDDSTRVGIILGTSSGTLSYALEQHAVFLDKGARRMHPSSPAFAHNGAVASECAIQLGVHGPVLTVSSACTSSTDAIGFGAGLIEAGVVDVLLVGGAEAPLTPALFASFDRLRMLPTSYNACPEGGARPFDKGREGLVLGEGAIVFVLERRARSEVPASPIEIAGYGATCDASSHFHQEETGAEAVRAVRQALLMAKMDASSIDFVSAHGTGTRENDPFEAGVLRKVLGGGRGLLVSASKSQCGHLLGASGALAVASVVASMRGGFVPPTLNLDVVADGCELPYVGKRACPYVTRGALCPSFGFGSRNAALIVRRMEE